MSVHYFRKAATDDPILNAADRMMPKLRQAFLDAVDRARSTVSTESLADAVRSGNVDRVVSLLAIDEAFAGALRGVGLEAGVASVRDALQATFAAGARAAVASLPRAAALELSFNLMDPKAVEFINRYAFDLIRQVGTDTTAVVRQVMERAFTEGVAPAEAAREIRASIGLTATQEKAVANYRAALESGDSSQMRSVLDRALRDGRYDKAVLRGANGNVPLRQDQIDKMVGRYRERYVKYRAETVARTETIRAANAGRAESWRQAKAQGLIGDDAMRKWVASGDDRTCDVCDDLDGQEVGLDEPFDSIDGDVDDPPAHPNCRCSVVMVGGKARAA